MEFDVIQGFKGPEAWTVTAPEGKCIQGVRLITNYGRSYNATKPFRSSNRRRRNQNVNRDDGDSDGETKSVKVISSEAEIEINAKGDSTSGNDKGKFF